jgi:hypothetical protein
MGGQRGAGGKADAGMNKAIETKCCNCRKPLDEATADYAAKYAFGCRDGVLGACCGPRKGDDDDGWGDAPCHGYDY